MPAQYIPLLIFAFVAAAACVAALVFLRRAGARFHQSPDEHSLPIQGDAPHSAAKEEPIVGAQFPLVGSLFLVLAAALVFLFPWAVKYSDWGWRALAAIGIFLAIVLSGYFWVAGQRARL
ncbi:MAG TPA: NADH-quinone oxidoreductase subunit A [Candidatus Acidoferrales bacterium]|nr:NADH-quinone oxidoreductase subunit A [Candidatus Acidoferrales bacterium]